MSSLGSDYPGPSTNTSYQNGGTLAKTGKILVFVNLGYAKLDEPISQLATNGSQQTTSLWSVDPNSGRVRAGFASGLDLNGNDIANVRSILSANGSWSIDENGNVVAESVESRKGFTTYDTATDRPYCIRVTNGAVAAQEGKCSENPEEDAVQQSDDNGETAGASDTGASDNGENNAETADSGGDMPTEADSAEPSVGETSGGE